MNKIVVNDRILKRLNLLCDMPKWAGKEIDLDLVDLRADGTNYYTISEKKKAIQEVEEFIKALHHKFPSLAHYMRDGCWVNTLPVMSLVEVFRCFLCVGDHRKFFKRLVWGIRGNPEALQFFTQSEPDCEVKFVVTLCFTASVGYGKKTSLVEVVREFTHLEFKEAQDLIELCNSFQTVWYHISADRRGTMSVQKAKNFVKALNDTDPNIKAQVRLKGELTFQ
jgi:hypothetical protein